MKKRKYNFMIVGCEKGLMIGMETKCGMKISRCITWIEIEACKCDVVEVNLDIMEQRIDDQLVTPNVRDFDSIFEVKLS